MMLSVYPGDSLPIVSGERFMIVPAPAVDRTQFFGVLKGTLPSDEDWAAADAEILADFEESLSRDENP